MAVALTAALDGAALTAALDGAALEPRLTGCNLATRAVLLTLSLTPRLLPFGRARGGHRAF